jgi:crossover junction endodeoxyribonuclease RuvC
MSIIGIDIGARGALALLSPTGELLDVADMPILRDGPANRPNVNAPLLASIVRRWRASQAFVEYVGARPKGGPTGAFAFERIYALSDIQRRNRCPYWHDERGVHRRHAR